MTPARCPHSYCTHCAWVGIFFLFLFLLFFLGFFILYFFLDFCFLYIFLGFCIFIFFLGFYVFLHCEFSGYNALSLPTCAYSTSPSSGASVVSELSSDHSATDLPGHFPPALTMN